MFMCMYEYLHKYVSMQIQILRTYVCLEGLALSNSWGEREKERKREREKERKREREKERKREREKERKREREKE